METIDISLVSTCIAFAVLILKSLFDLWMNRYIFDKQIKLGVDKLEALEQRNKRGNRTSTAAFAAMSIAIILSIGGSMNDRTENELKGFKEAIAAQEMRLKKVENVLWPPMNPGEYSKPTPKGPWDPQGVQDSLEEIKKELSALSNREDFTEDRLEKLITIVNKLTEKVQNYTKSVEQLEKFMKVPTAG